MQLLLVFFIPCNSAWAYWKQFNKIYHTHLLHSGKVPCPPSVYRTCAFYIELPDVYFVYLFQT